MNGIRTFILQDLSYILPSKGLQVHTTASARRFWNFFEFSLKEDVIARDAIAREAKKCVSSKDIVSTSLFSSNEPESSSRNNACLSTSNAVTPSSKVHIYQMDLKSNPMHCPKISKPIRQSDSLLSLLDGHPVPKTMKWKLKGYKTLRHEHVGDFAFVPGGNCYDLDILSQPESNEANAAKKAGSKNDVHENSLCLTTKAIENKQQMQSRKEQIAAKLHAARNEARHSRNDDNDPYDHSSHETESEHMEMHVNRAAAKPTPRMLATGVAKRQNHFLPISKSELPSATQSKYHSQPSVKYSSRPPRRASKPMASSSSSLNTRQQAMPESREASNVDKPIAPPLYDSYEHRATNEESSMPRVEPSENVASEWSSMEQTKFETTDRPRVTETRQQQQQQQEEAVREYEIRDSLYDEQTTQPGQLTSRAAEMVPAAREPPADEVPSTSFAQATTEPQSTYFAPRSWKYTDVPATSQSAELEANAAYETIMDTPAEQDPAMISSPYEETPVRSSPCAATQARLLQRAEGKEFSARPPRGSHGMPGDDQPGPSGVGGSSMSSSGSSGGGSRKPPASFPPFAPRRSASNHSCFAIRLRENPSPTPITTTPASNISTSSMNSASRKCCEPDECEERIICTKPRQKCCEPKPPCCERPKKKKPCKRYCCPALQQHLDCDFTRDQCKTKQPKCKAPRDPTCMAEECEEVCTNPCKKRRDSSKERKCGQRDRSCSKKKREPKPCREICTKPKRKNTCCKDRRKPTKCTGRRNYTQSAYVGRRKSTHTIKRYSSLPAFAFSLIGMRSDGESKQKLFDLPIVKNRFYAQKCPTPPSKPSGGDKKCKKQPSKTDTKCKSPSKTDTKCKEPPKAESKCKSPSKSDNKCKQARKAEPKGKPPSKTESKCKTTSKSENKCKKPAKTKSVCDQPKKMESICKPSGKKDFDSTCKPTVKKTESLCQPPKKSDSDCKTKCKPPPKSEPKCKTPPKKQDPCKAKSKSDDYCSKKRDQMCKAERKSAASSSCDGESMSDKIKRERKEMEECKKHIRKSQKKEKPKKKDEKGLERVTSPCKQQQKDPTKKMSYARSPFDTLLNNSIGSVIAMPEYKPFGMLPDRSYSMMSGYGFEKYEPENRMSSEENRFWVVHNDDEFEADLLPAPVVIENQEEPLNEDNFTSSNWFLSWFNNHLS